MEYTHCVRSYYSPISLVNYQHFVILVILCQAIIETFNLTYCCDSHCYVSLYCASFIHKTKCTSNEQCVQQNQLLAKMNLITNIHITCLCDKEIVTLINWFEKLE